MTTIGRLKQKRDSSRSKISCTERGDRVEWEWPCWERANWTHGPSAFGEQSLFYFSSRFRKRAHCVRTIFLPFLTFRSLGIIISWIEQILSIHQKNRGSQLKHKLTISVRWDLFIIPVSWRICCPKLGKLRKIVWRNVTRSRANGMSCTNPELGTPVWEWLPRVGIACG